MRIRLLLGMMIWHMASSEIPTCDADHSTNSAPSVQMQMELGTFTDRLFKAIAENAPVNLVYSPISLVTILSMVSLGADGITRQQLQPATIDLYRRFPKRVMEFNIYQDGYSQAVNITVANKIFLATGFKPRSDFTSALRSEFNSETQSVDFSNSAQASETINEWCAAQTNNHIKDLIKPGDIDMDTGIVLANAVDFEGEWLYRFTKTQMRPFYVNATTTRDVLTMQVNSSYFLGELPDVKAKFIEIPYKTNITYESMTMFVILPDDVNGIAELIKNFEKITIERLHKGEKRYIKLSLPKFNIETTINLKDHLVKLGLTNVFGNRSNFKKISTERPLEISNCVQKSFIRVNELGTEAASATGLQITMRLYRSKPTEHFKVDRPFISIIANEVGVVYFAAVIVDPSSKNSAKIH